MQFTAEFMNGKVRPIARPEEHQRELYNEDKRVHALKFRLVVAPNGMIANLYNPIGESFRNGICKILSHESNLWQFTIFN